MANEDFISYWEKTLQLGKPKFILKAYLKYFIIILLLDMLINKLIFGDPSVVDYIIDTNWSKAIEESSVWIICCLLMAYYDFWENDEKYRDLKRKR